jgi:ribosomal-protein-alanine N-acetyltransferase
VQDESLLEVTLRGYRLDDFEVMFALDELCFEPAFRFSRSAMRRFAEARRARVVLAESAGRTVGFFILHIEKSANGCAGYIVTLDVDPNVRRHGIARNLMANAEALIRVEGCHTILLHVFTGNAGAIAFYEEQGFGRTHTAESFYADGVDAFVYRKAL